VSAQRAGGVLRRVDELRGGTTMPLVDVPHASVGQLADGALLSCVRVGTTYDEGEGPRERYMLAHWS
jgi:hypothetical protein